MRSCDIRGLVLAIAAGAAPLSIDGCSHVEPPAAPNANVAIAGGRQLTIMGTHAGGARPESRGLSGPLLFVCDPNAGINIFRQAGKESMPVGRITNGVSFCEGVGSDRHRNVYITNGDGGTVTVYRPPYDGAPAITYEANSQADSIAIGSDGVLYVATYLYVSPFLYGQLVEFRRGHTEPSLVCDLAGASYGLAVDARNNLWLALDSGINGPGTVFEYPAGSGCGATNTGISVGNAGGLAFDSAGNLLVVDSDYGVDVFAPGATTPSRTIRGFSVPWALVLNKRGNRLYVDDLGRNETAVVSYSTGKRLYSIPGDAGGRVLGDAVTPKTRL